MAEGTREKVIEARRLKETGLSTEQACKQAGISSPTYYVWVNGLRGNLYKSDENMPSKEAIQKREYRKRQKIKVTELETKTPVSNKVFTFYGDPNGIAEIIRRLEG